MKKKVLHIVESFASGVFSFLIDLVGEMDDDYEIIIAYGQREETPKNFKDFFSNKIRFIKVENFTRSINPVKDLKAFFEIKKIIKEENPDIIHLHSSKAGFIGRFAANGRKRTMLYNPHGFSFLMKNSSKLKRLIYWMIEKVGSFRKCTIIGCSQGECDEGKKLTENTICINNSVNLEKLEKDTLDIVPNEIDLSNLKLCTLGRIGYQKNPELFNQIAKEFPENKFTWIGDGDLKEKLTSENIYVTGWQERRQVLEILNNNDIFILTSLWEGLPIALLEAMYMKKICIVSNCIGNRDVINKNNGFVCANIDEFKNVINNIKSGKCNIDELKENAYNDIFNVYNTKRMINEYKEIYEKLN